ncbi:MAG: hypothetical protein IT306_20140 [Chloroflexi bacterium]|nr:hypothetical protein [Chloroflexota bacterium]
MFQHLNAFGHQRTFWQAFGFYLVYLIAGILGIAMLSAVAGLVVMAAGGVYGFEQGLTFGAVLAVVGSTLLSLVVLRAKGLLRHAGYLLVALLAGASATLGGLILGLIFVAFLTTRPSATTLEGQSRPLGEPATY